jgi:hypothetical protein
MLRFALLPLLLLSNLSLRAAEPATPSAEEIMRLVRLSSALQDRKLDGTLRSNDTGREEPFTLTMTQMIIRFLFDNPKQIVHLDLAAAPPVLREVKPGSSEDVPLSRYDESVRGFDLNYEDLSLRFIYWPNPKLLGEENVALGQKAWKIRVTTPDAKGPYGTVDLWVHQGSGGMAKMEGYDVKGKLIRRYKIASVQKFGDTHIPEEMRIETVDPTNGKRTGLTYMTCDKPKKP